MAPDGVPRLMNVVNGQYPGPTIECNWGDTVVIRVQNNLENNGTSIHWHGLHQDMNSAIDGVPGVSQCTLRQYYSTLLTIQVPFLQEVHSPTTSEPRVTVTPGTTVTFPFNTPMV